VPRDGLEKNSKAVHVIHEVSRGERHFTGEMRGLIVSADGGGGGAAAAGGVDDREDSVRNHIGTPYLLI
jgi:hypothetical protein